MLAQASIVVFAHLINYLKLDLARLFQVLVLSAALFVA